MELDHLLLWEVLAANVVLLPFFVYLFVISLAAALARKPRRDLHSTSKRFLVAIPAHDEEAGILATVKSCLAVDYPSERFEVLVIADNCQDRTATLALAAGATVLERTHPRDRSKGHALRYLFDRLHETGGIEQLDAIVVIDADTVVDKDLLQGFAGALDQGHDWIQAYDTVGNRNDSWRTRLMAYSFGLINGVLLLGQTAPGLGLSAGFRGNGMCFSTRGLRRFPWQTFGLVEDLEYSWSLRAAGERIVFIPDVSVHATMLAGGGTAAANQRLRWEYGRSELKRNVLGPLIRSPHSRPIEKLAGVLDLLMPPLISLVFFLMVSLLVCFGVSVTKVGWYTDPLIASILLMNALSLCGLLLYGLVPFLRFSLGWRVFFSLVHLPFYALWKFSTLFQGPPKQWIRTARQ